MCCLFWQILKLCRHVCWHVLGLGGKVRGGRCHSPDTGSSVTVIVLPCCSTAHSFESEITHSSRLSAELASSRFGAEPPPRHAQFLLCASELCAQEMIHESAPKAPNRENLTIRCAAGAPPHVEAGTRRTYFISNLEEPRLIFAIAGVRNDCARHVDDVIQYDVMNRFLNGRVTWLSLALDFPPAKESRTIRLLPRNNLWSSTWE